MRVLAVVLLCVAAPALADTISVAIPASPTFGPAPFEQREPAVAAVTPTRLIVAWTDFRVSTAIPNIWMLAVDNVAGRLEVSLPNVPLWRSRVLQGGADIACGNSECLVTWLEGTHVYGLRVNASLALLDAAPLVVGTCATTCDDSHSVYDGPGWLVVFNSAGNTVSAARVSLGGVVSAPVMVTNQAVYAPNARVATDGTTTLAAWPAQNGAVTMGGFQAGTMTTIAPVAVLTPAGAVSSCGIGAIGTGYYVAWRSSIVGIESESGTRTTSTGVAIAPTALLSPTVGAVPGPIVLGTPAQTSVLYWDTTTGEIDETEVSMVDGGVTSVVSASNGGYHFNFHAASLGAGTHLVAAEDVPVDSDIKLLAIESGVVRTVDGGPVGVTAQSEAVAAWNGTDFIVVAFEALGDLRQPVAFRVSPSGAVSAGVPMMRDIDAHPRLGAALSSTDGGVAIVWADYNTVSMSQLNGGLVQGPLRTNSTLADAFDRPSVAQVPGQVILTVPSEHVGACVALAPSSVASITSWATACGGPPLTSALVAVSGSQLGTLAVSAVDSTVSFARAALPLASADAGLFFDGSKPLLDAGSTPRSVALAADGKGFLAVWWESSSDVEAVTAALISDQGAVTVMPVLSSRAAVHDAVRFPVGLNATFDGERYWVAYSAPGSAGGFDVYAREIALDAGVGPERILSSAPYDSEIMAVVSGTVGRTLFVTRTFDADAGAQRMTAQIFSDVPVGGFCMSTGECRAGACLSGVCTVSLPDGGMVVVPDAGMMMGDAGSPTDAGPPGDAGTLPDGGSVTTSRTFGAGCGCGSAGPVVLLPLVLMRRFRRRGAT